MKNIKEILKNMIHKNDTTLVGASSARPSSKARLHTKTILTILPILILLIATLITITLTNAANSTTEPQTDQTFTEEGDGYYIWVRAVDHAGNKRTLVRGTKGLDRDRLTNNYNKNKYQYHLGENWKCDSSLAR